MSEPVSVADHELVEGVLRVQRGGRCRCRGRLGGRPRRLPGVADNLDLDVVAESSASGGPQVVVMALAHRGADVAGCSDVEDGATAAGRRERLGPEGGGGVRDLGAEAATGPVPVWFAGFFGPG